PLPALARQADRLALADAPGNAHVQCPSVDRDAHAVPAVHGLERDGELRARRAAGPGARALREPTAPATEQFLEEVAEAAAGAAAGEDLLEVRATGAALAEALAKAAVRRTHLVARAVAALAQLVVRRPLLRVAQRLVGLVDRLELLLGA